MHSFTHDDIEHPKMVSGFLGSLRPYTGLNENNFYEVMQAIRVLTPQFEEDKIDKQVINSLWGICHLGWAWGIHPEEMLKRNNLITLEDSQRLEEWMDTISYTVMMLLAGNGEEAFAEYTG